MDFFEYPLRLLHMLWLAPLFGLLVYWSTAKRKNVLQALFGSEADANKTTTLSLGRRYARLWLLFAAALLLCVACARPRWGWRILPFSGRGRDLMVLIDVSKSMLSEDVRPSRLKHAKQFVRELIASTPGNRYGLVDFAGTAFLECPMTVDKTSLFQALDDLNVDSIPVGGTNIENALKKATLAFKAAEGGYKAIILITDGDELYGDSSQVVSELKKRKIPLFVVGTGDPDGDGLIKMSDARGKTKLMRDSMGKLVKSRLNEKGLKRLAEKTGGIYVRSTETNLGLAPIRERIKKLVPKEYSKGNCKRPIERFHYPLLAAVILLLIRLSIGERGRRRCLSVLLFVSACLFSTFSTFSADAGTATTSTVPPSAGLPIAAPADSGKKLSEQPITGKAGKTTPVALYNRALELHDKRKFKEAAKLYRRAVNMSKVSEEVRSKAFQNLGVISHQKGEALLRKDSDAALRIFDKAEEMYKESMRSDIRRKRVVLNQQRLLDDRRLAKLIKKRREEMRKKRERAREKTRKALNQQKKENQRKNKQQKNKQKKKQQSQQQKQRRQNQSGKSNQRQNKQNSAKRKDDKQENRKSGEQQRRNRNERQKKKDGQKQNAGKSDENREKQERKNDAASNSNSNSNAERKETERKIKQAEKSTEEYKKAARKAASPKNEKIADEANRELKKARKEHEKGKGEESEKHLRKALEKLAESGRKDKNDKGRDKSKKSNRQAGGKKKSKSGKDGKKKNAENKRLPKPYQPRSKGGQGRKGEKKEKIDPAQAAALLDMMANEEKKLRDAIKEHQKRAAGISKVPKDW